MEETEGIAAQDTQRIKCNACSKQYLGINNNLKLLICYSLMKRILTILYTFAFYLFRIITFYQNCNYIPRKILKRSRTKLWIKDIICLIIFNYLKPVA